MKQLLFFSATFKRVYISPFFFFEMHIISAYPSALDMPGDSLVGKSLPQALATPKNADVPRGRIGKFGGILESR